MLIGKYGTKEQIEEVLKVSELDDNIILQKYKNDGIEEGMEKGMEKGRAEGMYDAIKSLMESCKWTAEQAMEALKIPKSDFPKYMAML